MIKSMEFKIRKMKKNGEGICPIRQHNPKIVASRPLDIFVYQISYSDKNITNHEEALIILKKAGFKINPLSKKVKDIEEVLCFCKELEKIRHVSDLISSI